MTVTQFVCDIDFGTVDDSRRIAPDGSAAGEGLHDKADPRLKTRPLITAGAATASTGSGLAADELKNMLRAIQDALPVLNLPSVQESEIRAN